MRSITAGLAAVALATGLQFAVTGAQASVAGPRPTANPYSPAYRHGYRHGVVPTIGRLKQMRGWARSHGVPATSINDLHYGGGIGGVGVTTGPEQVYLVFWGSQWGSQGTDGSGNATFSGDARGVAPDLQAFFKGLGTGSESWSGVMTQYCEGVAVGAQSCPTNASHVGYPTGGALAGVWEDTSAAAPAAATGHQIGVEAENAAASHFGNTTAAANRNAQYVIVSPTGTDPDNYQTQGFCAWHDYTADSTLTGGGANGPLLAFTNLPYIPDAGKSCGADFVNAGNNLDGVTIVGGHEYAETITDQFPAGGWIDSAGQENGDKCAWIKSGQGASQNVTLTTGTFAVQSTWANDFNSGAGGCEVSHPIFTNIITVTNPGTLAGTVGTAVSLQIHASDSDTSQTLTYSASGLPAGLSINSSSGLISGTPTTASSASVTVTVKDTSGASGSASFSWTINQGATATVTTLKAAPHPSVVGGTVTYTATVSPNNGGGTVTFADNGTTITACASLSLTAAAAGCHVTYKAVGSHQVKAAYSGDASYAGSQATLIQKVTYAVKLLYNPTTIHPSGTSFYLTLQLRNAAGHDVSASTIVLTVSGLSPSPAPGKAPAGNFTFIPATSTVPAHYRLPVHSTGYPAHTYTLSFKVTGDPVTHTLKFII